jgi:hypothetical protein
MSDRMPVYVKIEEYKEVLEILSVVKTKLAEAKAILGEIEDLKVKEDSEIESWKIGLEDVDEKVKFVDQTLFEPDM